MVPEDRIEPYIPALRRLAASYAQTHQESEDLFQEIAVALWKALPKFRAESSERTFVYRVAHNTALRFISTRRPREQALFDTQREPATTDDPERDAIRNQQWTALHSAVRQLPITDRQVVLLRLEGLTFAEIAQVTGLTEAAATMRFARVRQQLTKELR